VRYELKDTGITVTALQPGPTDTEFFDRILPDKAKAAMHASQTRPRQG
jgi:uncharacterized protein